MESASERRRHPRFAVLPGTFAEMGRYGEKVGEVRDLGKGGLSFHYIGNGTELKGIRELSVWTHRMVHIGKLKVQAVFDIPVPAVSGYLTPVRRMGVAFGALSHEQAALLDDLLESREPSPA